jgi:glycosyltransferase involved in cell wall biosynthesis
MEEINRSKKNKQSDLVFYAPNVHTGGGLVLLIDLMASWPGGALTLILDRRANGKFKTPYNAKIYWVKRTVISRLMGEFLLWLKAGRGKSMICFHGLPPLLPTLSNVVVFLQNRNYLVSTEKSEECFKTRLRVNLERIIGKLIRKRVSKYIVQTPSMRNALLEWYGNDRDLLQRTKIKVIPFFNRPPQSVNAASEIIVWDFIYVADGVAHKNHRNLVKAWQILANENIRPSLCLTLSERDFALKQEVNHAIKKSSLEIYNIGTLSPKDILQMYSKVRALIFPSYSESFGLPLIEANYLNLPILASEMDFVRDVCIPVQTFDPNSSVSIARAVKRFLGNYDGPITVGPPTDFWGDVLGGHCA